MTEQVFIPGKYSLWGHMPGYRPPQQQDYSDLFPVVSGIGEGAVLKCWNDDQERFDPKMSVTVSHFIRDNIKFYDSRHDDYTDGRMHFSVDTAVHNGDLLATVYLHGSETVDASHTQTCPCCNEDLPLFDGDYEDPNMVTFAIMPLRDILADAVDRVLGDLPEESVKAMLVADQFLAMLVPTEESPNE